MHVSVIEARQNKTAPRIYDPRFRAGKFLYSFICAHGRYSIPGNREGLRDGKAGVHCTNVRVNYDNVGMDV